MGGVGGEARGKAPAPDGEAGAPGTEQVGWRGAAGQAGGSVPTQAGARRAAGSPAPWDAPLPPVLPPAPRELTRPAEGQEAQRGAPGLAWGRLRHEGHPRGAQAGSGSAAPDGSGVRGIPRCADSLSLDLGGKCSIKIQFGAFRLPPSLSPPPSLFPSPPVADVAAVNHIPLHRLWPAPPGPARPARPGPAPSRRPAPGGTGGGSGRPAPRTGPGCGLPRPASPRSRAWRRAEPLAAPGGALGEGTSSAPPPPHSPDGPGAPHCPPGSRARPGLQRGA